MVLDQRGNQTVGTIKVLFTAVMNKLGIQAKKDDLADNLCLSTTPYLHPEAATQVPRGQPANGSSRGNGLDTPRGSSGSSRVRRDVYSTAKNDFTLNYLFFCYFSHI